MRFLLVLAVLCYSSIAVAQENKMIIPEGATLLNISATESVEVDEDLLIANMRIEKQLSDPTELQQDINALMTKALDIVNAVDEVEASTEQYYVHEYYRDNNQKQKEWRGSQGLQLKSKSADKLLEVTGQLQNAGFLMNGLSYTLSPEKHEQTRESLLEAALKKLEARAGRVGKALGKPKTDMWEVNVDAAPSMSGPQPVMMRAMAMDSMEMGAAAPVAQGGKSQISMTVSAKVLLKP